MRELVRAPEAPPATPRRERAEARILGATALVVGLVWLVAIAYAVHPVFPYSPIRLPFAARAHTFLWAPQGWSFFTRDPREEKQTVYVKSGGVWESALLAPHGRAVNRFGLRRTSRAQGVEMGLLMTGAPADAWTPCRGSVQDCLAALPPGRPIRNPSPAPTMCGSVAIVLQRPVPWAWATSAIPVTMPSRLLPLEVACSLE